MDRRSFLGRLSAMAVSVPLLSRLTPPTPAWATSPGVLRRDRRYPRQPFAPFPEFSDAGNHGAGTFQMGPAPLLHEALDGGVRLVATSPDYRNGYIEKLVGEAVACGPDELDRRLPEHPQKGVHRVGGGSHDDPVEGLQENLANHVQDF